MNTQPFFHNQERITKLLYVADMWRETPWCANSSAQGKRGGVSCHNLPRAIYIECGALTKNFPDIKSTPSGATVAGQMQSFLDNRDEFAKVENPLAHLQPGDLVGLFVPLDGTGKRLRDRVVNHLGVVLSKDWFVHVLMGKHTDFDLYRTPPWSNILLAAWRPVEPAL